MYWVFRDESKSDRCTEGGYSIQENTSDLSEKYTGATESEGWRNSFSVDEGVKMVV